MPPSKVLPRLREQLDRAVSLVSIPANVTENELEVWMTQTRHWLEAAFGEDDGKVSTVLNAGNMRVIDRRRMSQLQISVYLADLLRARALQLKAVIELLEFQAEGEVPAVTPSEPQSTDRATSKKVFIVHGRDDGAKETVARFVTKLKLEPVILHEQPNGGRTLIEKFEAYSDVAYAIVLLTPDERGGLASTAYEEQTLRARQNVILELGYFLGALGRDKVCALYKAGTEIPSDYQGVLFTAMDPNDGWRLSLAKEIKQVIPTVDMNDAF